MPAKLRRAKRRHSSEAEVRAWWMFFTAGADYLDDLSDFGLCTEAEIQAAAPEAWRRLGADYMARWDQMATWEKSREIPWAIEQFGKRSSR